MTDPFLKILNSTANEKDLAFGVTLVVAGGVITGTLISAKAYVESFSDSFSSGWPGGPNEDVRAGFLAWIEPGSEIIHEKYIHLKDARYVSGLDFVPSGLDGMLWRGSLDSVSGFSLGSFNRS